MNTLIVAPRTMMITWLWWHPVETSLGGNTLGWILMTSISGSPSWSSDQKLKRKRRLSRFVKV